MAKTAPKTGFSFTTEAQIDVGLWAGGECSIKDIGFCEYDYGGTLKKRELPVVLLVMYQHAEGVYEQPYTIGDGWELPGDDKADLTASIIPTKGQTGFPKSSNAAYFFNSLGENGYALGDLDGDTGVKALVGQGLVVKREPQPTRNMSSERPAVSRRRDQERGDGPGGQNERTFLLVREVLDTAPVFGKASPAAKDKPKTKPAAAPEPDDDDDSPRKAKGTAKDKSKPNGAVSLDDEAEEALTEVLDHHDGQLALDDVEEKVYAALRKHPKRKEIAEMCADPEWLGGLDSVTFNKKKGIVALAGE